MSKKRIHFFGPLCIHKFFLLIRPEQTESSSRPYILFDRI